MSLDEATSVQGPHSCRETTYIVIGRTGMDAVLERTTLDLEEVERIASNPNLRRLTETVAYDMLNVSDTSTSLRIDVTQFHDEQANPLCRSVSFETWYADEDGDLRRIFVQTTDA